MQKDFKFDSVDKRSFTLIELLVAVAIFSILILTAATTYINFQGSKRRAALIQYIKNEGDFLMERIKREIRTGTVDYEEYYHQNFSPDGNYASKYSSYGRLFFDKGYCGAAPENQPTGLKGYGIRCVDSAGNNQCDKDYWTESTAACPNPVYDSKDLNLWSFDIGNALPPTGNFQNELYLIDSSGTRRTILRKHTTDPELIALKLVGEDLNSNGIIDSWFCADDFLIAAGKDPTTQRNDCTAQSFTYITKGVSGAPLIAGLPINLSTSFFVSVTPERLKVTQLKFFISPLEDPRKAADEDLSEVYVTIILSVKPKDDYAKAIPGDIPEYTMQTTVTAGAKNFIPTWHGVLQN